MSTCHCMGGPNCCVNRARIEPEMVTGGPLVPLWPSPLVVERSGVKKLIADASAAFEEDLQLFLGQLEIDINADGSVDILFKEDGDRLPRTVDFLAATREIARSG